MSLLHKFSVQMQIPKQNFICFFLCFLEADPRHRRRRSIVAAMVIFYRRFSRNSPDVGPITRMRQLRETLDPRYLGGRDIVFGLRYLGLDLQPPSTTLLTVMERRRPDYRSCDCLGNK